MTRSEFIKRRMEEGSDFSDAAFVIRGLEAYKNSFYFEPQLNWDDKEFDRRCTQRWVVSELEGRIKTFPDEDPFTLASEMLFDFMEHMNSTPDRTRSAMFRVASETAEEIIDFMRCML